MSFFTTIKPPKESNSLFLEFLNRNLKSSVADLSSLSQSRLPLILISDLQKLELKKDIDSNIIEELRTKLIDILNLVLSDYKPSDILLVHPVYEILIIFAEFKPVNTIDPITQDEISSSNKIFVSTGHLFDIQTLIQYHNNRDYRGSALGETDTSKWLVNPIPNLKFNPMDVVKIKNHAENRMIVINHLKPEASQKTGHKYSKPLIERSFFQPLPNPNSQEVIYTQANTSIQAEILEKFLQYGLTADYLRNRNWFTPIYTSAFQYLFEQRHLNAEQAIQEIEGLDVVLVRRIAKGATKIEIQLLNNNLHLIDILIECKRYGLTADHLQGKQWLTLEYLSALQHLFTQRNMNAQQAMQEIDGLSGGQARRIAEGKTRTQLLSVETHHNFKM